MNALFWLQTSLKALHKEHIMCSSSNRHLLWIHIQESVIFNSCSYSNSSMWNYILFISCYTKPKGYPAEIITPTSHHNTCLGLAAFQLYLTYNAVSTTCQLCRLIFQLFEVSYWPHSALSVQTTSPQFNTSARYSVFVAGLWCLISTLLFIWLDLNEIIRTVRPVVLVMITAGC